jgi:anti-sigma factor RsiW
MTGCGRVEALAFGELELAEARAVKAHAGECEACGEELRAVGAERAFFHRRAAGQPALDRVELFARVQREVARRTAVRRSRQHVTAFALMAASVLVALSVSLGRGDRLLEASAAGCGLLESYAFAGEPAVCRPEPAESALEASLQACLVATPVRCR